MFLKRLSRSSRCRRWGIGSLRETWRKKFVGQYGLLDVGRYPFPVGRCVGSATVPDDVAGLRGTLIMADAALYEAKRAGRNRIIENTPPLANEAFPEEDKKRPRWTPIDFPEPI